ncbi:MAG: carboxypeptidase-like regulatory domain-containing protein [Bacteroidales bacterium]
MGFDKKILLFLIFTFSYLFSFAQESAVLYGKVSDENGDPLLLATIAALNNTEIGTSSDSEGNYELKIKANTKYDIQIRYIGYKPQSFRISLKPNTRRELNIKLESDLKNLPSIEITDSEGKRNNITRINPKTITDIPTISGGIEDILPSLGGVSKNNELSSQYNVRGGNYDENLIYVNDFEIYRPQLVRSSQQEGLSFINSDLVRSIEFSAGGFPAKFGDKLSSVLDIQYKKPIKFGGSVILGILGQSAHVEGTAAKKKIQFIGGFRRKSFSKLLNTLDTKGQYDPEFIDFQGFINYDINPKWQMSVLGYFGNNTYKFIPENRSTKFGTTNEAYQFNVFYEGNELDKYKTLFGGWSTSFKPNKNLDLKLILSGYQSTESESFDILGQYYLGELEKNMGDENFGKAKELFGIGGELKHARNRLFVDVFNIQHKGSYKYNNHKIQWGIKYQYESISDRIGEYNMIDSSNYSIPSNSIDLINPITLHPKLYLYRSLHSRINLNSNRITAFAQNTLEFEDDKGSKYQVNFGLRGGYWDVNKEFFITPRANFSYKPNWERNVKFNFAAGLYYQPPFYKELRNMEGIINKDVKAQKSWQLSTGVEYNFQMFNRPFKMVGEAYYKGLWDINPYSIENVQIRYFGNNNGKGFAKGIDFRINGEFVSGLESYVSVSLLDTKEEIKDSDYYEYFDDFGNIVHRGNGFSGKAFDSLLVHPGYLRRPSDQLITASFFFQDNLPINPTYKVHLKLVFGSRLPTDVPNVPRAASDAAGYTIPPYRRIDIGFSKIIIGEQKKHKSVLRHIKSMSLNFEVFNLFNIVNVVSYDWVRSVDGRIYGIPNYLTGRQFNLRLITRF